jgi:tripartite-type tricarboxylate transporter receptor subunit TctC
MQRVLRFAMALLAALALPALAQSYPDKPLHIVVGFAPGGAADVLARTIAQGLGERLGQSVIVDNRPGASGMIAAETVAKAAPDGYTLLMASPGEIAVNPSLYKKMAYDPLRDLVPVTLAGDTPLILVVAPESPVHTVDDLVRLARSKPGEITYASAGAGSAPHLAGKYLELVTGTSMLHVPYKGGAQAITAMLSKDVAIYFSGLPPAIAQIRGGKLRAIAVTGAKRTPLAADVPTFEELGIKDFDITNWFGVFMPAGTPAAIVKKVQSEIARVLATPAAREHLAAQGLEAIGGTSDALDRFVHAQSTKYADLIKRAGIEKE